jgi:hypothetical protein
MLVLINKIAACLNVSLQMHLSKQTVRWEFEFCPVPHIISNFQIICWENSELIAEGTQTLLFLERLS